MANMTVEELRSYLNSIQNDTMPNISADLFRDFCNDLNQFTYENLLFTNPNDYLSEQTFNVTSGTDTYALNADFQTINAPNAGIWSLSDEGDIIGDPLLHVSDNNDNQGYFISGTNIVFRPKPKSTATYKMKYVPELALLTSDTDSTIIPTRLKEYAKYYIRNALFEWHKKPSSEVFNDQKFARAKARFMSNTKKAPTPFVLSSF